MLINSYEKLSEWLSDKFLKLTDAEPAALAKYTLALIKKDMDIEQLRNILLDKLRLFLADDTDNFVEELLSTLDTESYMDITLKNEKMIGSDDKDDPSGGDDNKPHDDELKKSDIDNNLNNNNSPTRDGERRKRRRHSSDNRSWDHRRISRSPRYSRHDRSFGNRNNRLERYYRDQKYNNNNRRNDQQRYRRNDRFNPNNLLTQQPHLVESFINSLQSLSAASSINTNTLSTEMDPKTNPNVSDNNVNILTNLLTTLAGATQSIIPSSTNIPYNRQNFRNNKRNINERTSKYDCTMKTLCVSKIPAEYNNEQQIIDFFIKFGHINHIIMNYNGDRYSCLIEFKEHNGAKAAYTSPDVVFGNRFVKLFWLKSQKITPIVNNNPTTITTNENNNEKSIKIDNPLNDNDHNNVVTVEEGDEDKSKITADNITPKIIPTTTTISKPLKKEDASFVSKEYLLEKEQKMKELIDKKNKMKQIEDKIIVMCLEEQKNILSQLKNPDLTPQQKENLTNLLKVVVEKKDSIIFKNKYQTSKQHNKKKNSNPTTNQHSSSSSSNSKTKKPQPMVRKIDHRTTEIIIILKPNKQINPTEIITSYKKFGKILSTTIVEGKHIIITYTNHKNVVDAISYGVFMPEYIEDVRMYEIPTTIENPPPPLEDNNHLVVDINTTNIDNGKISQQLKQQCETDNHTVVNITPPPIEDNCTPIVVAQEGDQEDMIQFLKDFDE